MSLEKHPDFQYEMKLILKMKKRRLCEAERNKNMQIKNVQALYAFEVENIAAGMKVYVSVLSFLCIDWR
jgi:hypothetical protein